MYPLGQMEHVALKKSELSELFFWSCMLVTNLPSSLFRLTVTMKKIRNILSLTSLLRSCRLTAVASFIESVHLILDLFS